MEEGSVEHELSQNMARTNDTRIKDDIPTTIYVRAPILRRWVGKDELRPRLSQTRTLSLLLSLP